MIRLIGWIGAAGLSAAPFFLPHPGAFVVIIFSFVLLTFQVARARLFNLVFLNIMGVLGYSYSLYHLMQ